MSVYSVIGLQWGDEGKGKIVDYLTSYNTERYVLPYAGVRFNGGNNAGHTVVRDGKTYKLSLIPTSILSPGTENFISMGVVVDIGHFAKEVLYLQENGVHVSPDNLSVDPGCPLILPTHIYNDQIQNKERIGSTCRGIGPAYCDFYARKALRVSDLFLSTVQLLEKFPEISQHTIDFLDLHREHILPYIKKVSLDNRFEDILFEGAQGMMLDVFHGTYPYVTSSPAHPAFGFVVTGFMPSSIDYSVVGVTKAYATRVGEGPFPTELIDDPVANVLSSVGKEVGTVTGRQRRVGWLDLTQLKYAADVSGTSFIALTKIDVLDTLEEIYVGIEGDGVEKPIRYERVKGWCTNTAGIRDVGDLPSRTLDYASLIEEFTGREIAYISTGRDSRDIVSY